MQIRLQQARRRVLLSLLAITTGISVGPKLLGDDKLVQPPVQELSKIPAFRAVGIRMVGSNTQNVSKPDVAAKLPKTVVGSSVPLPSTGPSMLPASVPVGGSNTMPSPLPPSLPSSALLNLPSIPPALPTTTGPTTPVLPPVMSSTPEWSLQVPPATANTPDTIRTADTPQNTLTERPLDGSTSVMQPPNNGKVVVKLNGAPSAHDRESVKREPESPLVPPMDPINRGLIKITASDRDSVGIRVVQEPQVGPPVSAPSLVFNSTIGGNETETDSKSEPVRVEHSSAAIAVVQEPIRILVNDKESGESRNPRTPTQVKIKAAQIATVAETSEISLPIMSDESKSDARNGSTDLLADTVENTEAASKADLQKRTISSPVGFVSLVTPMNSETKKPNADSVTTLEVPTVSEEPQRPAFEKQYAKITPLATIELECQSASAMDVPGLIRSVAVQDEEICRVLHNERTISFVGDKPGTTLVQVWTSTRSEVPQIVRVKVSQPWQKPSSTTGDIRDVRQVVSQAFPTAKLNIITQDDGTMEVRGVAENEDQAVRILEMVRKLCLVPVKDKIQVKR